MPSNIDSMQQEAMRRVQEMHSRTHSGTPRRTSTPNVGPPAQNPIPEHQEAQAEETVQAQSIPLKKENRTPPPINSPEPEGGLLERIFHDKERSLIMLLILILANENAKPEALIALMYLVM